MVKKGEGILPVLHAEGRSTLEAWENSVVELYKKGLWWHRKGDKDKGRETLDSTMTITITEPDSNLFYHKYMTCTPESLFDYQMEILGSKDSWVHPEAGSTKWPYHYHERFASYPGTKGLVNQIERLIQGISEESGKRRHNMITWVPERDFDSTDPPCLQRIWFDIIPDELAGDGSLRLNMNYNFRSRNVMIAAPMNMIGLHTLYSYIKKRIIEKSGMNLKTGRIVDFTDSYHVSAQDTPILERFMERYNKSIEKGEDIRDRCFDKEIAFMGMDKEAVVKRVLEQTKKELIEKGQYTDSRFEEETKKVMEIYQEVSNINGY
jgi:thymidylate synthase